MKNVQIDSDVRKTFRLASVLIERPVPWCAASQPHKTSTDGCDIDIVHIDLKATRTRGSTTACMFVIPLISYYFCKQHQIIELSSVLKSRTAAPKYAITDVI